MTLLEIYIIFAIGYNILSQITLDIKGRKWAPTEPMTGVLIICVLYLWFKLSGQLNAYVFLLGAVTFIYMILRSGVIHHIRNYSIEAYLSRGTWAAAYIINIFGFGVLVWTTLNFALALN